MNINTRTIAIPIPLAFTVVAVFGLYIIFFGHDQATDCPLMPGEAVLCANFALVHITHWRSAFTAIFAEALLLIALAFLYARPELSKLPDRQHVRLRTRERDPDRPTLFQELFSQGILNRKAPEVALGFLII